MIRSKYMLFWCLILPFINGCGGDKNGDGSITEPEKEPQIAALIYPENNTKCNEGTIISQTQSKVTFRWEAAAYANRYVLVITNLNDNSIDETLVSTNYLEVTLLRGTPYSWYVISKSTSSKATAKSETWRVYNAGVSTENYAPFPAELVSPMMGATTNTFLNLSWKGSDVDNDITEYEIYLDKSNPPNTSIGTTTNTKVAVSDLDGESIYYWKIITYDNYGNNSESQVFEFRTN